MTIEGFGGGEPACHPRVKAKPSEKLLMVSYAYGNDIILRNEIIIVWWH